MHVQIVKNRIRKMLKSYSKFTLLSKIYFLTQDAYFVILKLQYGLVLVSTGRLKTVKLSVDCDHVKTQILN